MIFVSTRFKRGASELGIDGCCEWTIEEFKLLGFKRVASGILSFDSLVSRMRVNSETYFGKTFTVSKLGN